MQAANSTSGCLTELPNVFKLNELSLLLNCPVDWVLMAYKSSSMTLERPVSGVKTEGSPEAADHLTPERLAGENRRHDRVLAALLFLLGFLLASFPVMN